MPPARLPKKRDTAPAPTRDGPLASFGSYLKALQCEPLGRVARRSVGRLIRVAQRRTQPRPTRSELDTSGRRADGSSKHNYRTRKFRLDVSKPARVVSACPLSKEFQEILEQMLLMVIPSEALYRMLQGEARNLLLTTVQENSRFLVVPARPGLLGMTSRGPFQQATKDRLAPEDRAEARRLTGSALR